MLDSVVPRGCSSMPAYWVMVNGTLTAFSVDGDAFAEWAAAEGNELAYHLPDSADASPGLTLSELVYRALSAGVITGDSGIELNIHGHADGAGFSVRLNNRVGRQIFVGLTRGRHELGWPPNGLAPSECARYYLQEICCIANSLLADLLAA